MWLLPLLFAPLMLQESSLSETSIAFSWGGYVWTVPREGGAARQITTGGHETDPQLERAVELTLETLKNQPVSMPPRPKYPNYHTTRNP